MPGSSLDKDDILALRESQTKGVVDILSSEELQILNSLSEECLHPDDKKDIRMSLKNIISSVRKNIFDGIALPDNFPSSLKPMFGEFNKYSNEIGIVINDKETSIDKIKKWIISKLSAHNNVSEAEVRDMLEFKPRTWFDGPVSIRIISQSDVEKISRTLPSE